MIKKLISGVVCTVMLLCALECFASVPITVELDRVPVTFDQDPLIINDRTMVPVRAIFEAMGATVDWNGDTKTVTSTLDGTTVEMVIDSPAMTVNHVAKPLDTPPLIVGGRTLVPARAVSESFGCTVEWIAEHRQVRIYTKAFQKKLDSAEPFSCVKKLKSDDKSVTVAFGMTYFDGYDVKTNLNDGTDIVISKSDSKGHISLNVRTDLYVGEDTPITDEYVKDVAENLVSVLSGTLVSSGVTNIGGTDFMVIEYTKPGTVGGIYDEDSSTTICIGRKDGVVYTLTYSVYGDVSEKTVGEFAYMMDSLIFA